MEAKQATKDHCRFCFEVLVARLQKKPIPGLPASIPNIKAPLFVTWTKKGELRGCIGTFSESNLATTLPQYALISALEDERFEPITLAELPHLQVTVSILVDFRKNQGLYDWKIGEHGVIAQFTKHGRSYSATFLPEVALEQKWDHRTTLQELVQKSGYPKPLQHVEKDIKLTTYRSSLATLSYKQFAQK